MAPPMMEPSDAAPAPTALPSVWPPQSRTCGFDAGRLAAFAARRLRAGVGPAGVRDADQVDDGGEVDKGDEVDVEIRPLSGGLEATAARVVAREKGASGDPRRLTFVVKRLHGPQRREATVYQALLHRLAPQVAPRLLAAEVVAPDTTYLYLEYVRPARAWPWNTPDAAALVLKQLAAIHATLPAGAYAATLADWDYEADLCRSAVDTLECFDRLAALDGPADLRRSRPALRRMVGAIPVVRRALLAAPPLGPAVLHGDVHSGNALLRAQRSGPQVVLLDWGRARLGSPLEDVSSWLQSLGGWEPAARRRHDTLLRAYLVARGMPDRLARGLRDAYWLAGACNALAGALRYWLSIAYGWPNAAPRARARAMHVARHHLRLIRRADAIWRGH
jgi:aminoglycoside phosphotransferase (APT) family kinase protein